MDDTGILGYFHRGAFVIAIHADWPTYPGQGPGYVLYDLGQFPHGTEFSPIDDIDKCVLFVASGRPPHVNEWSDDAFHVAAWHSDLIDLANDYLIDGIVTAQQIASRKVAREVTEAEIRRDIEAAGGSIELDEQGESYVMLGESKYPLSDYHNELIEQDDLLEEFRSWGWPDFLFVGPSRRIGPTQQGWAELEDLLVRESSLPHFERLRTLADLGFYDTAIRDAGVLLECSLRKVTESEQFGLQLVNSYLKKLDDAGRWKSTYLRRLRNDLRTAFKFIRNEFAHRIVDVPPDRALAVLARLTALIEVVEMTGQQ